MRILLCWDSYYVLNHGTKLSISTHSTQLGFTVNFTKGFCEIPPSQAGELCGRTVRGTWSSQQKLKCIRTTCNTPGHQTFSSFFGIKGLLWWAWPQLASLRAMHCQGPRTELQTSCTRSRFQESDTLSTVSLPYWTNQSIGCTGSPMAVCLFSTSTIHAYNLQDRQMPPQGAASSSTLTVEVLVP